MLDSLIFQKTELGKHELTARELSLSNTLRLVLVLIDGRRNVRTLAAFSDTVGRDRSCLETLMQMGLIEPVGETSSEDEQMPGILRALAEVNQPTDGHAASQADAQINHEPYVAAAPAATMTNSSALVRAKQMLSAELRAVLGENADMACARVYGVNRVEELLEILPKLTDLVGLYTTRSRGEQLHDKIRDLVV
jgi:hypothetical protein